MKKYITISISTFILLVFASPSFAVFREDIKHRLKIKKLRLEILILENNVEHKKEIQSLIQEIRTIEDNERKAQQLIEDGFIEP